MLSWPKYKLKNLTIYLPYNFFHLILAIGHVVCFVRLADIWHELGHFTRTGKKCANAMHVLRDFARLG